MGINTGLNAGIAIVDGGLISVLIDGKGTQKAFNARVIAHSGSISYPPIVRTGRGTDATATVAISGGAITTFTITKGGFSYGSALVTITGGGGAGATATATVTAGVVTAATTGAGGTGYTAVPTVAIAEGSGSTPAIKLGDPIGSGKLTGQYQFTGVPFPDLPKFATGTIRHVMQTSNGTTAVDFIDIPASFTNMTWTHDEGSTDLWQFEADWSLAGNPALTWQGQQIQITPPTANDRNTYESLTKVYDSNGITTSATTRTDCETIGNSNAAEVTKLVALWASLVTPVVNLKPVSFQMVRTESNGIAVVSNWGFVDSKDAINNPQTRTDTDPNDLQTTANASTVFTTSTPPGDPGLPSGLKLRSKPDVKINDQLSNRQYTYAKNDTIDDYQLPETWTVSDASNLRAIASGGTIDGTPATPGGYVLRTSKTLTVKTGHTFTTREFGLRTTAEDIERPGTHTIVDPGGLKSRAQVAKVGSTPSLPVGFVERETDTYSENSLAQVKTISGGLRTTAEDITFPGTSAILDPLLIDSTAKDTEVYLASGGVPAAPAAPSSELQLISTEISQETELMSSRLVKFDVLNSQQKRAYPHISTTIDANNIDDAAPRAQFWNTGDTPPATPTDTPTNNVKLVDFTDVHITPTQNMRVWVYGPKDSRDKAILPNTETTADASNLEAVAVRACLYPAVIVDPTGYTLRFTKTIPLTMELGVNRILTIKIYGLRTTANDLQMPATWTLIDPYSLDTQGQKLTVYTTAGGVPADPTPPNNADGNALQIVGSRIIVQNDLTSAKTWHFGVTNSAQKAVIAGTESMYSTVQANRKSVAFIVTSSDTDDNVAATWFAIFQGSPGFLNVVVKSLDPYRKRVIANYIDPGIQVLEIGSGGSRLVEHFVDAGTVKVWVDENKDQGGGARVIYLGRNNVHNKPTRRFIVTRMMVGTTVPDFSSQFGTTNNATFYGLAAGSVKYNSCSVTLKLNLSGASVFFLGYHFESDANLWIQSMPQFWFRRGLSCTTAVTTQGAWVDASTLGLPFVPIVATQTNFANFLS